MATQKSTAILHDPVMSHPADHSGAAAFPIASAQYSQFRSVALTPKPINWSKLRARASFSPSLQKRLTPVIKSYKNPYANAMTLAVAALDMPESSAVKVHQLPEPLLWSPELFAEIKERGAGLSVHAPPVNVAAEGMVRLAKIYRGVLGIRSMMTWLMFRNVLWEKNPFSGIRDMCDRFLNLFKDSVIARVFGPPICWPAFLRTARAIQI